MECLKHGDLVQLKNTKELGIIIDDFDQEIFKYLNIVYVSNMSRKILMFKESGPEIDFIPNFNMILIQSK